MKLDKNGDEKKKSLDDLLGGKKKEPKQGKTVKTPKMSFSIDEDGLHVKRGHAHKKIIRTHKMSANTIRMFNEVEALKNRLIAESEKLMSKRKLLWGTIDDEANDFGTDKHINNSDPNNWIVEVYEDNDDEEDD